jgi:hypothetical protein
LSGLSLTSSLHTLWNLLSRCSRRTTFSLKQQSSWLMLLHSSIVNVISLCSLLTVHWIRFGSQVCFFRRNKWFGRKISSKLASNKNALKMWERLCVWCVCDVCVICVWCVCDVFVMCVWFVCDVCVMCVASYYQRDGKLDSITMVK